MRICAVVVVLLILDNEKKAHNRPKLLAKSLVPRRFSPWCRMLYVCLWRRQRLRSCHGSRQEGLSHPACAFYRFFITNITWKVFELFQNFAAMGNECCLPLALDWHYTGSAVHQRRSISVIFCSNRKTFNVYKRFGCMLLLEILSMRKDCRVRWPDGEWQNKLSELTRKREPILDGGWGFLDGLNF